MKLFYRKNHLTAAVFVGLFSNLSSQNTAPNVIFILTDDQGSGDLGCYGNKDIKTPNIDALANQGFRFSNFHSGTTSAPTRAGLLTGKNGNSTDSFYSY